MPSVIFIHGYPGVGKSTVAQLLAKKHHYALLRQDAFLFSMNGVADSERGVLREDYVLAMKNMRSCLENFLASGRNVIIEGALVAIDPNDPLDIQDFFNLAHEYNAATLLIELKLSERTRKRRMRRRHYVVPEDIDNALKEAGDQSDFSFEHEIDTTRIRPRAVVEQIESLIAQSSRH